VVGQVLADRLRRDRLHLRKLLLHRQRPSVVDHVPDQFRRVGPRDVARVSVRATMPVMARWTSDSVRSSLRRSTSRRSVSYVLSQRSGVVLARGGSSRAARVFVPGLHPVDQPLLLADSVKSRRSSRPTAREHHPLDRVLVAGGRHARKADPMCSCSSSLSWCVRAGANSSGTGSRPARWFEPNPSKDRLTRSATHRIDVARDADKHPAAAKWPANAIRYPTAGCVRACPFRPGGGDPGTARTPAL